MAWDDLDKLEHDLTARLSIFDWDGVDKLCAALIVRLPNEGSPFPEPDARRFLTKLRRKRRFTAMGLLADALIQSGLRTPQIRRQYAQALIDQGMLTVAELALQSLISDAQMLPSEQGEARGLMGRVYKQLYVNAGKSTPAAISVANLLRAFNEYSLVYTANPKEKTWHGINMVALLARAEADQIHLEGVPDYKTIASDILVTLAAKEAESTKGLEAFDVATELEALVALGKFREAERKANQYADSEDADAFEFASTLRQFEEVWQLKNDTPPGSALLPILRAARTRREGGGVTIPLAEARQDLQKVFGAGASLSLKWYLDGLGRSKSVCRLEFANGKGNGTGWLVRSADFFPSQPDRLLVLTNSHVISPKFPNAIRPPNAWANFQLLGKRIQMKSIVWSSPVSELDATFIDLQENLEGEAMPLSVNPVEAADPGPRMYIIGHPGGRDLEFSLQDNRLIACNTRLLHYRTPTEGGSSGSPVFEPDGWQVVALHHAGSAKMQKLDGPSGEFYEANEGIAILAIRNATRAAAPASAS